MHTYPINESFFAKILKKMFDLLNFLQLFYLSISKIELTLIIGSAYPAISWL